VNDEYGGFETTAYELSPAKADLKHLRVHTLVRRNKNAPWEVVNGGENPEPFVQLCRDSPAERFSDLLIVVSNAELEDEESVVRPAGPLRPLGGEVYASGTASIFGFDCTTAFDGKAAPEGEPAMLVTFNFAPPSSPSARGYHGNAFSQGIPSRLLGECPGVTAEPVPVSWLEIPDGRKVGANGVIEGKDSMSTEPAAYDYAWKFTPTPP
jgi:hypothetical protein